MADPLSLGLSVAVPTIGGWATTVTPATGLFAGTGLSAAGLGAGIASAAGSAGAAGAGAAASQLLAPDIPDIKLPEPKAPAVMPDPFGQQDARKAVLDKAKGRKGRRSTFLADDDEYAAPTYTHSRLGE